MNIHPLRNMHNKQRFAVSRLHLPDGSVLRNQVIETEGGMPVRYYALVEELHSTTWRGGDFYWKAE